MAYFVRLLRDQRGANAIEYALVAALISVAAIAAFTNLGSSLVTLYQNVSNSLG